MKPKLICILCSTIFMTVSFSQKSRNNTDILPEVYSQAFDFILKLDSLDYISGSVKLENTKDHKKESLSTRFEALSDSTYNIRIKKKNYLLNTISGEILDSKTGELIYRNPRFRYWGYEKTGVKKTDEFGSFTAYFAGFRKDIPSDIVYDAKPFGTNQTIQYQIICTPTANDYDSTWIEKDTTTIIKTYNEAGKLTLEHIERKSSYRSLHEIEYTYSGDTVITNLVRYEYVPNEVFPDTYVYTKPYELTKRLHISGVDKAHKYEYLRAEHGNSMCITDINWLFGEDGGMLSNNMYKEVKFSTGGETHISTQQQTVTFKAKKR